MGGFWICSGIDSYVEALASADVRGLGWVGMVKGLLRVATEAVHGDRYVVKGVVVRDYNGMSFKFREDGYFNVTHAAKHFGKEVKDFNRLPSTLEYIAALSNGTNIPPLELVQSHAGRYGGTWAHPKLAVFFARWLDVKFAVFCDMVIDDLIGGHATITVVNPEKAVAHTLPQTCLATDRCCTGSGEAPTPD